MILSKESRCNQCLHTKEGEFHSEPKPRYKSPYTALAEQRYTGHKYSTSTTLLPHREALRSALPGPLCIIHRTHVLHPSQPTPVRSARIRPNSLNRNLLPLIALLSSAPSIKPPTSTPLVRHRRAHVLARDNVLDVRKDVAHLGYRELDAGFRIGSAATVATSTSTAAAAGPGTGGAGR
jgi:hypothetical protein